MDKDYNIDDILSEVKKRREEQKDELLNQPTVEEAPKAPPRPTEVTAPPKEEKKAEPTPETAQPQTEEKPKTEPKSEAPKEEPELRFEDESQAPDTESEDDGDMVNIIEISEEEDLPSMQEIPPAEEPQDEPVAKKKMSKKTKNIIIRAVAIILALVVCAGIAAYAIANNMINNLINNNKDNTVATTESEWTGMDKLVESFEPIEETEATELASLQDVIKDWYYNGKPCKSTHVLNVLLIGEDTRGEEILDEGTRADSAIIVSLNIDTKQITMTSILRDAWAYWETEEGKEETGQFGKINAAMSTGNINAYINCLENLYKISIDNYAIVNFDSFENIVNELGGVTLEITTAEINEINSHPRRYGHVKIKQKFEGNKGKQKLNGRQALAYCRIRKLDSDNMRADRQKTCLIEIFNQTKNANKVTLLKVINTLIPYVKTNFSKNEIVKIAKYAFTQGWLDFDIYMQNMPENNLQGGIYYGQWIWRPDYAADAYKLQSLVYSKSSITLASVRPDTAKCPEKGFYSEGSNAMYSTIKNNHYGEVTEIETTTKKEEASE
ncbi:MAG: LCP family protein [Eubacterium sp.]|nr:LCP family protein [Eubacterium sp.]